MSENPKVFISYSHVDEAYEKKVLDFANKLRSEGIDASIDLYEDAPKEGWPRWMENQIRWADYVLVIASKSYYDKAYTDKKGKGISWEVNIVYQNLYDANAETSKYIPVFFDEADVEYILTPLKPFTYYNLSTTKGYDDLYWRLRGVSKIKKPELGKLRPLEPKKQKTSMFISTPIDLDKWNAAGWKGMIYLLQPGAIPILGLLFRNYVAAEKIFKEWKEVWKTEFADENLVVNYVIPPFPKDCYVYKEQDHNYGKGYFIYIGPNVEAATNRALKAGMEPEGLHIMMISRNIWVDEMNGSTYREMFTQMAKSGNHFMMVPMAQIDESKPVTEDNLRIGFDLALSLKNFTVKKGTELDDNDPCKCVLKKPVDMNEI